jgi:hypothetical protein
MMRDAARVPAASPRDFDLSPCFEIVKPALARGFDC